MKLKYKLRIFVQQSLIPNFMKKVFTLFLFFLCISSIGFSQEKENFNNLTSGKWQIASVEIENEFINVAEEGHWMVFHSNGLYQIVLDKDEQIGTWSLAKENEIKFDAENFNGESYIKKISDKELRFSISGYHLALTK